jgi:hypothetical protein
MPFAVHVILSHAFDCLGIAPGGIALFNRNELKTIAGTPQFAAGKSDEKSLSGLRRQRRNPVKSTSSSSPDLDRIAPKLVANENKVAAASCGLFCRPRLTFEWPLIF